MRRIAVTLDELEFDALAQMAKEDMRYPSEQLSWILRQELIRRKEKSQYVSSDVDWIIVDK